MYVYVCNVYICVCISTIYTCASVCTTKTKHTVASEITIETFENLCYMYHNL